MKLTSVEVSNYKCIRDACHFDVSDITCLVGMNESGKTALLEALHRLNPVTPGNSTFNVDDDFPRIDVEDYRLDVRAGKRAPATVVRAAFALESDDCMELEKDFPGALSRPELVLRKGYDNMVVAEMPLHEEAVIQALARKSGVPLQQSRTFAKLTTIAELANSLPGDEKGDASKKLMALVAEVQEKGTANYFLEKYLWAKVPQFLYFDEFYQLVGHVNIESLIQRQKDGRLIEPDYPLLGLIDLARMDLKEIINPGRALERDNRLEGASNHLTKTIMKYWSQNRFLELRFDIRPALPNDPAGMQTGTNLWCHVYNSRQKVRTLLGDRSRGFVWFFSFLAWFSQQKKKNIPLILLLDEPALFLHCTAQSDLLRYLEDESRTGYQVIYTTQSPYLINSARFDRVRIVEDMGVRTAEPSPDTRPGTQVFSDVHETSQESILPLYGALGLRVHKNLLVGPHTLMVGSVAEFLFCTAISAYLTTGEGWEGLDEKWNVIPVGGSAILSAFVSLIGDAKTTIQDSRIIIRESDLGGFESFFERNLLQRRHVFSYNAFTGTPKADVEDMFEQEFYLSLVNREYKDILSRPMKKSHLSGGAPIKEQISKYFSALPSNSNARFDPFRAARYFVENSSSLKSELSKDTLTRFENLFKAVNSSG